MVILHYDHGKCTVRFKSMTYRGTFPFALIGVIPKEWWVQDADTPIDKLNFSVTIKLDDRILKPKQDEKDTVPVLWEDSVIGSAISQYHLYSLLCGLEWSAKQTIDWDQL